MDPELTSVPPMSGAINYYPDMDDEQKPLLSSGESIASEGLGTPEKRHSPSLSLKGSSEVATFFNFAKASVGSGSFALPWGILQIGVILGSFGMVFLGVVSVYTMQLMLECKNMVSRSLPSERKKSLNYTELGKAALGWFGKWAVNISVLACNLGVCAGYMIFISSNLQWAITCLSNHHCLSTWEVYAFLVPVLILLTFLPSFNILAYAAYVGYIFLAVAMIVVYVYGRHGFEAVEMDEVQYMPPTWEGVALWFGVTAFLFCVHSMVIPLESSMKRPWNMPYVLDAACVVVVGINLPFAIYGYLLFGSSSEGYVFENLPGGVFNDTVRLFLSLELTLTFPIVFKPASQVMEEIWHNVLMLLAKAGNMSSIHDLYHSDQLQYRVLYWAMVLTLRTLLVLVAWSVAVGIPRFELCLALVGSLATSILAFILPPLFHLALMWRETHISRNILHGVILVLGIIATVTATGVNLDQAIQNGGGAPDCTKIISQC